MRSTRRLTIQAQLDTFTSYGIAFTKIFFELRRRGIHVAVRPTKILTPFRTTIPNEILASVVTGPQPEPWEVLFGAPIHLPTPGKKTFYWTACELFGEVTGIARQHLDKAEVVAFMNRDPMLPKRKTLVLPLGIDPAIFMPSKMKMTGVCRFGTAGRLAHGKQRKGIDIVIGAFLNAFDTADASLEIKLHPDCDFEDTNDSRIKVIREHWPETAVAAWLQSLTAYVSGAAKEGFGLWPLQAMACGRPVISHGLAGLDYLKVGAGYITESKRIERPLDWWYCSDQDSIGQAMRNVFDDRETAAHLGLIGYGIAEDYTVQKSVDRFVSALEQCGALERVPWFKRIQIPKLWQKKETVLEWRYVHVYSAYECSDSDHARNEFALSTWPVNETERGQWNGRCLIHLPVKNSQLNREFIDETRRLPFVKDMIDRAAETGRDVIILTNSDTCVTIDIGIIVAKAMLKTPAVAFTRREFQAVPKRLTRTDIVTGQLVAGYDAFAFMRHWWLANRDSMPDLLLGAEGWDSVLAALIRKTTNSDAWLIDGEVYHVKHVPLWREKRFVISSQRYNRHLAREWFKKNGVESPIDPDPEESKVLNLI